MDRGSDTQLQVGWNLNKLTSGKGLTESAQQTQGSEPMLFYCWPTVFDVGPTSKQHWLISSCLLVGNWKTVIHFTWFLFNELCWLSDGLLLVHHLWRRPNTGAALCQCFVSAEYAAAISNSALCAGSVGCSAQPKGSNCLLFKQVSYYLVASHSRVAPYGF